MRRFLYWPFRRLPRQARWQSSQPKPGKDVAQASIEDPRVSADPTARSSSYAPPVQGSAFSTAAVDTGTVATIVHTGIGHGVAGSTADRSLYSNISRAVIRRHDQ